MVLLTVPPRARLQVASESHTSACSWPLAERKDAPRMCAGGSGTGKSTTLRLMAGLLAPDRGEVIVQGVPRRGLASDDTAVGKCVRRKHDTSSPRTAT